MVASTKRKRRVISVIVAAVLALISESVLLEAFINHNDLSNSEQLMDAYSSLVLLKKQVCVSLRCFQRSPNESMSKRHVVVRNGPLVS